MSYTVALDHAIQLVDWVKDGSHPWPSPNGDALILKLELRFLITFLKYTVHRCTHREVSQLLFTQIEDVGQHIKHLHSLLSNPTKQHLEIAADLDDAVGSFLDKMKLVKPGITQVQLEVSASSSRLSDGALPQFIDSLLEELIEILSCDNVDLIQYSLKGGFELLKERLTSLKGLLSFAAKRCDDRDKLNQLLAFAQTMADGVALLAYSSLMINNNTGEDVAFQLSDLVQRFDPVNPQVHRIYIQVLKASKSYEPNSTTYYQPDQTVVDYVDSLLHNTSGLLLVYRDMFPMKDQIEILLVKLKCLRYFLKLGNSDDLLAEMEVLVINAGSLIYSLFNDETNRETRLGVSRLLDQFELVEVQIRKIYVKVDKKQTANFPRTNELGALNLLLRNLNELLKNRVDSITLFKDHIQIIKTDLEFIASFLATITTKHHENAKKDRLWRRIIHVMYEVEYVIDLVVVKDSNILHHLLWLSDLIKEMKFFKREMKEIEIPDENMNMRGVANNTSSSLQMSQMNAPRSDAEMVGFKDEEKQLIDQLKWGTNHLKIVSIVGMPGLGKTFLANKVYNNPVIRKHFHVRAWCVVSQVHQRKEMLMSMLTQVSKSIGDMSNKTDEELAALLKQSLLGQKYLIVLDDIWDIEAWDDLKRSFPDNQLKSRVVFTSRFSNLALQEIPDSELIRLRTLSESESWELLQKRVFQKESCPLELVEVGRQIALGCNGLPLTIVVVGGVVARTKTQEEWRKVGKSLGSYIKADPERRCMDVLDVSYKSLPDYLKSCFLYFGAFPEDREIPVLKLIQLWIAEGFVQQYDQPELEYIAEGYLMDLIDRNLIIASKEKSIGGVKTCLVHDLVRQFCLEKAEREKFLKVIEVGNDNYFVSVFRSPISYEQRRLIVHITLDNKYLSNSSGPWIRSLLFFARVDPFFTPNIEFQSIQVVTIIHGFKLLRVLDLLCFNHRDTFPAEIGLLVQLRYLGICGVFGLCGLPSSISNLRKLETFIVRGMVSISMDTILNMTKLRHLCIGDIHFPKVSRFGISSQLDSLQTLSLLKHSYDDDMKFLRRFPNLKKLTCFFPESRNDSKQRNQFAILNSLDKLESFKVSYYHQLRNPFEASLPSTIKKLTLLDLKLEWEHISIVGRLLPNLQVLKLLQNAVVGEEWNMEDGEFPELKFLKLHYLQIQRWISSEDNFPLLEKLTVSECRKLEEIPCCLADISTLKLIKVDCYNDSLNTSFHRIEEEQRDFGNQELVVEINNIIKI